MSMGNGSFAAVVAMTAMGLLSPAHADSDASKLRTVTEMFQAWRDLKWDRVYALFAENGVLHSMMDSPVVGREAIAARLGALAQGIERIDLKVDHIGVIDGRVFVERVDHFVYKGHQGAVPVVGVLEIEHGKIVEWREYYDRSSLLKAMGVESAPAKP